MPDQRLSRREAIGAAGAATVGLVLAGGTRTPVAGWLGADTAEAAACASLTPAKEIGPYFVEEKLNRSDIRVDPSTGQAVAGVPLALNWTLVDETNGCAPVVGAQVDIWHAAPDGKYSDEAVEGTTGKKYLRGYQVSDASGKVNFTTVYPGWYSGRTVHIHVRIRVFDSSGTATYDLLTQLFFDDAVTDGVYTVAPYNTRGARNTRNADDRIYGSDGATVQPALTGDNASGYGQEFTFGLTSTGATTPGTTTTGDDTTALTDTTVKASLLSGKVVRTALGSRVLQVKLKNLEAVSVDLRLLRGSKQVKRRKLKFKATGTHTLKLSLPKATTSGRATLDLTVTDSAGNEKVLTKALRVPRR